MRRFVAANKKKDNSIKIAYITSSSIGVTFYYTIDGINYNSYIMPNSLSTSYNPTVSYVGNNKWVVTFANDNSSSGGYITKDGKNWINFNSNLNNKYVKKFFKLGNFIVGYSLYSSQTSIYRATWELLTNGGGSSSSWTLVTNQTNNDSSSLSYFPINNNDRYLLTNTRSTTTNILLYGSITANIFGDGRQFITATSNSNSNKIYIRTQSEFGVREYTSSAINSIGTYTNIISNSPASGVIGDTIAIDPSGNYIAIAYATSTSSFRVEIYNIAGTYIVRLGNAATSGAAINKRMIWNKWRGSLMCLQSGNGMLYEWGENFDGTSASIKVLKAQISNVQDIDYKYMD